MSQEQEFRELLATRPDRVEARLITNVSDQQVMSMFSESDVKTAIARGLRDYITELDIHWPGGRHFRFIDVMVSTADTEVFAKFPSASVFGETEGEFEDMQCAPAIVQVDDPRDRRYVRVLSNYTMPIEVTVWATDKNERTALCAMLDNAFDPVDWMSGFRLELPFYFNARATYLCERSEYMEDEDDTQKRRRKAKYYLTGTCPKIVPIGPLPNAHPRVSSSTNGAS